MHTGLLSSLSHAWLFVTPRTITCQSPLAMGLSWQEYCVDYQHQFSSGQSLNRVWLFATPWTAARQASLSITNSRSSLRLTSIESVMPSSHPILLSSLPPPAPNPSQHQSLFQWINSSHEVAKVLEFQLQHHSLQRNPRADLLQNGLVGSPCSPRDSQESSPTVQKHQFFSAQLSSQSNSHIHTWPLEKP